MDILFSTGGPARSPPPYTTLPVHLVTFAQLLLEQWYIALDDKEYVGYVSGDAPLSIKLLG